MSKSRTRHNLQWFEDHIGKLVLATSDRAFNGPMTVADKDHASYLLFTQENGTYCYYELTEEMENLSNNANTISGWIKSCKNKVSIPTCKLAVQSLVHDRFRPLVATGKVDNHYLTKVVGDLQELIYEQEKVLKIPHTKPVING